MASAMSKKTRAQVDAEAKAYVSESKRRYVASFASRSQREEAARRQGISWVEADEDTAKDEYTPGDDKEDGVDGGFLFLNEGLPPSCSSNKIGPLGSERPKISTNRIGRPENSTNTIGPKERDNGFLFVNEGLRPEISTNKIVPKKRQT